MKYFIVLFLFLPLLAFGQEEIVVRLTTDSQLAPLYLDPIKDEHSGCDQVYLNELHNVLTFDLSHNAKTKVVAKTTERLAQVKKENAFDGFQQNAWKDLNVQYVVKVKATDHKLSAAVYNVANQKVKIIENVPLSGILNQDRRAIHQMADMIHLALFDTKGVCQSKILYTVRTRKNEQNSEQWTTEVWEADYDGANAHPVTKEGCLCVTPTYIPPKQGMRANYFFYVSYRIGQPKIFLGSVKDGEGKRISFLRGNQLMPAISRMRDKIAFISDIAGNPDLFVQDFDAEKGPIGKPRQIFSAPKGTQGSPSFSPDGKRLAFVSNKDGTARIYVITIPKEGASLETVKPLLISKKNKDNTSPAWSYDGTKIAYSSTTQGVRQIWIYDFNSNKEMQLTQGSGHKENPVWAPDSLHLIFNSSSNEASELYLVNMNQPEAVKISKGSGEKRFPSWEPFNII